MTCAVACTCGYARVWERSYLMQPQLILTPTLLRASADLITRDRYTTDNHAENALGQVCLPWAHEAVRFSAAGAYCKIHHDSTDGRSSPINVAQVLRAFRLAGAPDLTPCGMLASAYWLRRMAHFMRPGVVHFMSLPKVA